METVSLIPNQHDVVIDNSVCDDAQLETVSLKPNQNVIDKLGVKPDFIVDDPAILYVDPTTTAKDDKDILTTIDISKDNDLTNSIAGFKPTTDTTADTTLVLFVSGHGSDGIVETRPPIIENIMNTYYPTLDATEKETIKQNIIDYMLKNIDLAMALGKPASLAPMRSACDADAYVRWHKRNETDYQYRWEGLSSSAADIEIVRNVYKLYQTHITNDSWVSH